ncbi:hypothetical protein Tco_0388653 [Tanacetum coccineum]
MGVHSVPPAPLPGIFGARTFGVGTFGAAGTFCEVETLGEAGTVGEDAKAGYWLYLFAYCNDHNTAPESRLKRHNYGVISKHNKGIKVKMIHRTRKNVLTGKDGISVYLCPADNEERVDKTMEATPVIAIYMLKDIYKVTCSD